MGYGFIARPKNQNNTFHFLYGLAWERRHPACLFRLAPFGGHAQPGGVCTAKGRHPACLSDSCRSGDTRSQEVFAPRKAGRMPALPEELSRQPPRLYTDWDHQTE